MISVLLAIHNGAETIDQTLAAMSELDAPAGSWKLIVVNNASTDDTEARVLKWQDRLPLEYVTEPRLGKSKAINTAFRHAEGDFIVMTDDDVLPERNWLTEWRRVADTYPQCVVFGGAVVPEFESAHPPDYVPTWVYGALYGKTHSYDEGEIEPAIDTGLFNISGANIAIRTSVYADGNRFDETFLVGTHGLMGEDTEFVKRLSTAGYKVGFAPGARLRHIVHARQTSWPWIRHRFRRNGRAGFMLRNASWDAASGKFVFRFPWDRVWSASGSLLRLAMASLRGDKDNAFKQSHGLTYDLAAIEQAIKLSWRQAFHKKPGSP